VFPQVTELRLSNCPDLSLQASGVANRPENRRQNSKGIEKNQKDMGEFLCGLIETTFAKGEK
jgi:hypothetical protein